LRVVEGLRLLNLDVIEPFDWVLAVLHAFGGRAPSKLHIQKALFIASRHIDGLREVLEFKAYRMGPWSEEVGDAMENAVYSGLLVASRGGVALTHRGATEAEAVWKRLSDKDREVLKKVADFSSSMSGDELLLYVYAVYGYTWESDVTARLLEKRKELALSMLRKHLVSVELAAKIAGMPLHDFIGYLKRKKVKPYTAEVNDYER